MKLLKKISILLLILSVNINYIYAQENNKVNNNSQLLQHLNILRGNGNTVNVNKILTRSEAVTFIIRLLGKDEEVNNNKEKYRHTAFTDVPESSWFAPYVGYCVEKGIVSGYSDKTFKPNNIINEQSFLKLLLTALGYKNNVDFTWNGVIEFSRTKNLTVRDRGKEIYTKGYAIDAICSALKQKNINTNELMIQTFIAKNNITRDKAIASGLINDSIKTEVKDIRVIDQYSIELEFNEPIQDIKNENILLYKTKDITKLITIIKTEKVSDKIIQLTTKEEQDAYEDYIVHMINIIDMQGNTISSVKKKFIGYIPNEVESVYFKISRIEPISNNVIYVYYTQPVNGNVLTTKYYNLKKDNKIFIKGSNDNLVINKLSTNNRGVSIYFKNYHFQDEEVFNIDIDGDITSDYGVKLKDGMGDSAKFKSVAIDNKPLELEECMAISHNTIQLVFNKAINPVLAKQVFNFYVTSDSGAPIRVSKADVDKVADSEGRIVKITVDTHFAKNKKYNIMINNINDITKQFNIIETKYSFIGYFEDIWDVEINDVIAVDSNTIEIKIDRALDETSARNVNNYSIRGITDRLYSAKPASIYYDRDKDPYMIKLYLPRISKLKESNAYNLKFYSSIKDASGRSQLKTKEYVFDHSGNVTTDIIINEALVVGEYSIKVTFNKELALDIPNVLNNNYYIYYIDNGVEYKKTPIGVNIINPRTIVLRFDDLNIDNEYKITYEKLKDYGGYITNNLDRTYYMQVITDED